MCASVQRTATKRSLESYEHSIYDEGTNSSFRESVPLAAARPTRPIRCSGPCRPWLDMNDTCGLRPLTNGYGESELRFLCELNCEQDFKSK